MPIGALGDAGRQVFALLRRLREELKVNTTCGLSNISFGLPHRHGINAAFIPMVIGAGMTSAIMNPCRPQEMEAVRGANVLNGTDANCTDLDQDLQGLQAGRGRSLPSPRRAQVNAPGEGRCRRRAPARRARGADGAGDRALGAPFVNSPANIKTRSFCSCRRASAGAFRSARRSSTPRARSASMSRASAAGARTCGRCQIEVQEGNFAKHKIVSSNEHISPKGPKEERYERVRGLPEGRRLSCSALILGDLVIDVPQDTVINAQVVRKARQRPRHRAQCRRPALLRRGRRARHAQAARRPRPAEGRCSRRTGAGRTC